MSDAFLTGSGRGTAAGTGPAAVDVVEQGAPGQCSRTRSRSGVAIREPAPEIS